jgi:hypothetical protein
MEWISAKERLPEKEQRILLYIEDRVYVGIFYDNNKFTTFEYDNCCNTRDPEFEKVTHWMQLPDDPSVEKPKEVLPDRSWKEIYQAYDQSQKDLSEALMGIIKDNYGPDRPKE